MELLSQILYHTWHQVKWILPHLPYKLLWQFCSGRAFRLWQLWSTSILSWVANWQLWGKTLFHYFWECKGTPVRHFDTSSLKQSYGLTHSWRNLFDRDCWNEASNCKLAFIYGKWNASLTNILKWDMNNTLQNKWVHIGLSDIIWQQLKKNYTYSSP